jgi:hypothetical protein
LHDHGFSQLHSVEHSLKMWLILLYTVFCLCYRTNICNYKFVRKDIESTWIQLPEEVRAVYGQKYIEKCQVNIKLANDSCAFVYLVLKYSKSGRSNPLYGPSLLV